MNHPADESLETDDAQLTTVLSRVRPTVVVRRRIYEVARSQAAAASSIGFVPEDEDDDDSGPPSSVNVARALASLRVDELHRLEAILTANDEHEREPAMAVDVEPAPPSVPTMKVGSTIAIGAIAHRMNVTTQELVTALVTRGFFDVTIKSTLSRETARAAAWMFGWVVEDDDELAVAPPESKPKAKPKVKVKLKVKVKVKVKVKASAKARPKAKPAKKKSARRS